LKVIGSVGHPVQHTEFKVVDSETDEVLPPGSKGILKVKGPPVMKGYFKVIYFVKIQTFSKTFLAILFNHLVKPPTLIA
jgi:acyl-CoA synthetase (AMP-forming)/AMP-acid ligase II